MRYLTIALGLAIATSAIGAAGAQDEALSRECWRAYLKLCAGIPSGPAMVGVCNEKRPDVINKIPQKCIEDFENKVEGYNASK